MHRAHADNFSRRAGNGRDDAATLELAHGLAGTEKLPGQVDINDGHPLFQRHLVDGGIALTKFWFSVTPGEQHTRFAIRQIDPVRQWKLSPTDIALLNKWDAYTAAKVTMFERTHTDAAPWTVIRSNDKKRARLAAMRSLLAGIDYDRKDPDVVGRPDPLIVGVPADMREMDPGLLSPKPFAKIQLGGPAPG